MLFIYSSFFFKETKHIIKIDFQFSPVKIAVEENKNLTVFRY